MSEADPSPHRSVFPGFADIAEDPAELIERLSERRRTRGLSQTEVAARMGTSQSALARLESGQADVRVSTLARYAAALDADLGFAVRDRGGAT
ncbi:MAG: helix-turn-helix transcriptional regulator [Actinomycetota bacterium]